MKRNVNVQHGKDPDPNLSKPTNPCNQNPTESYHNINKAEDDLSAGIAQSEHKSSIKPVGRGLRTRALLVR